MLSVAERGGRLHMETNNEKAGTPWFLEQNPLLESIPKFEAPGELLDHLSFSPLADVNVSALSIMDKLSFLDGEKTPLEPTSQSLRAATAWYGMLVAGLRARNPLLAEARQRYWSVLNGVANDAMELPRAPTTGIAVQIVKGPTGTAKTATARRFCALLGGQRVDHGPRPAAGWCAISQLVYLYSDFSHDGSRGGFLTSLLFQIDKALGTHYATDLPKKYRTVEKLSVATIGRLTAHYTGIIFLDEGQLRNLMLSDQAALMQMFLLSLMNSGIPLVLIGNERAFDWIDYSQDLTRLNTVPPEYFYPIGAIDHEDVEDDWDSLCRGVFAYYVLDAPAIDLAECKNVLRRCSGGIARLALILWTGAQRLAIYRGSKAVCSSDIREVYENRSFDDMRPLADGFALREPEYLLRFPDVAVDYYAHLWNKPLAVVAPPTTTEFGAESRDNKKQSRSKRNQALGPSTLKREQTRKKNEEIKRLQMQTTLAPDDIRRDGLKNVLLEGLDTARAQIESEKAGTVK